MKSLNLWQRAGGTYYTRKRYYPLLRSHFSDELRMFRPHFQEAAHLVMSAELYSILETPQTENNGSVIGASPEIRVGSGAADFCDLKWANCGAEL